jgi:hypothetical protein
MESEISFLLILCDRTVAERMEKVMDPIGISLEF